MITCLVISLLFGALVVWTGPAFDEPRRRLLQWRNYPRARVTYLPTAKCRGLLVENSVSVGTPLA